MILIVEFGFPRSSGRRAGVGLVAPQARIDASRSASRRFAVLRLIPAFVLRWPAVTGDTPQWSPFASYWSQQASWSVSSVTPLPSGLSGYWCFFSLYIQRTVLRNLSPAVLFSWWKKTVKHWFGSCRGTKHGFTWLCLDSSLTSFSPWTSGAALSCPTLGKMINCLWRFR